MFRAEKTDKNSDDLKVLAVGAFIAVLIFLFQPVNTILKESRWYRDIAKLTPFYNVELTFSRVAQESIVIEGLLTKRRCQFNSLTAYVYDASEVGQRAKINTKIEEDAGGKGNRPNSNIPEKWGPWTVENPFGKQAKRLRIYAGHVDCPSEPIIQSNLFLDIPWEHYDIYMK